MDELTRAAVAHRKATEKAEQTRAALHAAILAALAQGVTQADVVRATGYTRERIRQITLDFRRR